MHHILLNQYDNISTFYIKDDKLATVGKEDISIYKEFRKVGNIPVNNFLTTKTGRLRGLIHILKDKIVVTEPQPNYGSFLYFYSLYGGLYKKMEGDYISHGKTFETRLQIREEIEKVRYNIIINSNTYAIEHRFKANVGTIYNENFCSDFLSTKFNFVDTKKGQTIWEIDFSEFSYEHSINHDDKFIGTNFFNSDSAPILYNDKVLINTKYNRMVAADIHTGKIVWESLHDNIGPDIYYHEGKLYTGDRKFTIFDFDTGQVLKELPLSELIFDKLGLTIGRFTAFDYPFACFTAWDEAIVVNIETLDYEMLPLQGKIISKVECSNHLLYVQNFQMDKEGDPWGTLYVYGREGSGL